MTKVFNPTISLVRVLAMLSIIVGHLCTTYGINTFQLGGLGVEIFLFISGYLLGPYTIVSYKNWGGRKCNRLIPPLYLTVIIYSLICFALKCNIEKVAWLTYLFNLQGLPNLVRVLSLPRLNGMGQTWFVTVIAICYVSVYCIKGRKIENLICKYPWGLLFVALGIDIVACFLHVQLSYIIQFYIGYFMALLNIGEKYEKWYSRKNIIVVGMITVVIMGIRIYLQHICDGSVLYDMVVARLSFNILAVFIIMVFFELGDLFDSIIEKVVSYKWWKFLDRRSYHFFLSHYMFVRGPVSVLNYINNTGLQIVLIIVLTVVVGMIVGRISEQLTKVYSKHQLICK